MIKSFCLRLIVLSGLVWLTGCNEISRTKTIKLAHSLDVTHPVHKSMVFMGEELLKISNGALALEIYPAGQLGTERQSLELLQIGSLGMTKVSVGVMENFAPNMKVLGLPYIFRNEDHYHSVVDGEIGKELLLEGEKFWLRGLCYYDAGSRSFYTKNRPIRKPEDLKGLKIRVMNSQTAMQMVKALGGAPTPISWGELYTSLQQGVVDGAENNAPSFYTSHHYEVCKYYSIDEHTSVPDVLVIGATAWKNLDEQEKSWLQQAVDASVPYQRLLWKKAEEEAMTELKKAGVEIIYPEKEPFVEEVQEVFDSYRNDKEMYSFIMRIREMN